MGEVFREFLDEKKLKEDWSKMKCLNYEHLGHVIKQYPKPIKVRQYLQEGDFVAKTSVAKLGSNLISFKCKMGINMVFCLLDLGTTHSFVKPSVVE